MREAVLGALKGGMEVPFLGSGFSDMSPQGLQQTAPICCITLEPLLLPVCVLSDPWLFSSFKCYHVISRSWWPTQ